MTTGQRIAAKRKELELSQEGLGEALGVSRQSIYKWESDASLPEIDKLVALSRLFRVSVGWLLGVEEEPEEAAGGAFTEAQMKMIEELLRCYQQPQPNELSEEQQAQVEAMVAEKLAVRPRRRRWPYVLAAGAVVLAGWYLLRRLDQMNSQYNNLANSINNVTYSVNSQIGSITNRVEEVLKAQNSLTADYSTELISSDLANNTVTFSLRVVPKTYIEGMEVVFLADGGGGPTELVGRQGPGHEFTAEITCELTDSITLSAVFISGDTSQTQLLDNYSGLYSSSYPEINLDEFSAFMWLEADQDGLFHLPEAYVIDNSAYSAVSSFEPKLDPVEIQSLKVGLFLNQTLVQWLEPCEQPPNFTGAEGRDFYRCAPIDLAAAEGDTLCFAALLTDRYGRQQMYTSLPAYAVTDGELTYGPIHYTSGPEEWTF